MKIGKKAQSRGLSTRPEKNNSKKSMALIIVIAITAVLILWVYTMGRKAEETVDVVMLSDNVYKNQVITESVLKKYPMLKGEFEKYATTTDSGEKKRRILLWSEKDLIINSFAAYPLKSDTVAMYNDFITSKVDNSDSVLYSFPGKNIVSLDAGQQDLESFKAYLQPGDRINVTAIYKTDEAVKEGDTSTTVETYKEEPVFTGIMLADLLNSQGDSILDLFQQYNDMSTYEQANLDASESWVQSVTPANIMVALTPEEESEYYKYLSKDSITFKISLPQRSN